MDEQTMARITRDDGWASTAHIRFDTGALSVQLMYADGDVLQYSYLYLTATGASSGRVQIHIGWSKCIRNFTQHVDRASVDLPNIRPTDILRAVYPR